MADLSGQTIASSYEQLLSLPDGGGNANTLVAVTDGDAGTTFGIKLATNKVEIIPGSNDTNAFEVSQADGTAVLTVDSTNARVGIGGAPAWNLQVGDQTTIFGANLGSDGVLIAPNANNTRLIIEGQVDASIILVDDGAADNDEAMMIQTVDGTTKFRSIAEDTAAVKDNILCLDHGTGNVGINTSSPQRGFVISNGGAGGMEFGAGDTASIISLFNRSNSSYTELDIEAKEVHFLTGTSPAETMRIDSSGDVGIGISPTVKLHVKEDNSDDDAQIKVENDGTGDAGIAFLLTGTRGYSMGIDNSDGDKFIIGGDDNAIGATPYLTIDHSDSSTSFSGTITNTPNTSGAYAMFVNQQNSAGWGLRIAAGADSGDNLINAQNGSGTEKFVVKSDGSAFFAGNVGIGTGSANALLHCRASGTGSIAHLKIDGDSGSGDGGSQLSLHYNDNQKWKLLTRNQTSVGSAFSLQILDKDSNNGVFINQDDTSFTSNSDERMKENIVELENATDKLNTLRCVNYNMKHDESNEKRIGLIAQDVYKIYPEATNGSPDNEYSYSVNNEGSNHINAMGLKYTELIAPMIKAIQELSAKVTELEKKLGE